MSSQKKKQDENEIITLESIDKRLETIESELNSFKKSKVSEKKQEEGWFYMGIFLSTLIGTASGLLIEYLMKVFELLPEPNWPISLIVTSIGFGILLMFLWSKVKPIVKEKS